jgi:WhiB family redox-sensing transcriptional regulator
LEALNIVEADTSWFGRAQCKGLDPAAFIPDPESTDFRVVQKIAEAICKECPVIIECAQYAFDTNEKNGTWGGKSSWGSSSKADNKRYIQRLKLQQLYNQLQEMPDSRKKRQMLSRTVKELRALKNIYRNHSATES